MTTIKHSFKTDRIYNFVQEIFLIIERERVVFDDPSRNICGYFELDEDDMIVKAMDAGHTDLVKALAQSRTMITYDSGTHKWLSPFKAAQLFQKVKA